MALVVLEELFTVMTILDIVHTLSWYDDSVHLCTKCTLHISDISYEKSDDSSQLCVTVNDKDLNYWLSTLHVCERERERASAHVQVNTSVYLHISLAPLN
jgi:hypothetical protein